jgi:hypothetical protein
MNQPPKKRFSRLKKAALAAAIIPVLAAGTHIGLSRRVRSLNEGVYARNEVAIKKHEPLEYPFELHYKAFFSNPRDVIYNPNKPGRCSAYALRAAKALGQEYRGETLGTCRRKTG